MSKRRRRKRQRYDVYRAVAPFVAFGIAAIVFTILVVITRTTRNQVFTVDIEIVREEEPVAELVDSPAEPEVAETMPETTVVEVEVQNDAMATMPSMDELMTISQPTLTTPTPAPIVNPQMVAMIKSPVQLKSLAGSARSSAGRNQALQRFGGSGESELAVLRALRWLKRQQRDDGSWSAKGEGDATAFALLAFLAHGESFTSPEFGPTVKHAVEWLVDHHKNNMAVYALAEAAAVIRTPVLAEVAETAVGEMCRRQPATVKANAGGVIPRYCAVMSTMSARLAKLKVPELAATTNNFSNGYLAMRNSRGPDFAKVKGKGAWHFMVAGVCLQYLGHGNEPETRKLMARLDEIWEPATLGTTEIACCPVRSNYFSTMIFFNGGGPLWQKWNQGMLAAYVKQQIVEGDVGYWRCQDEHIGDQPFWPTCYIVHQLMVYYRYLPTYAEEAWKPAPTPVKKPTASPRKDEVLVEVDI